MTQKYRFVKVEQGHKWYALSRSICSLDRKHAGLFTEDQWQEWGKDAGLEKEELGEDQVLRAAGAMTLPGLD